MRLLQIQCKLVLSPTDDLMKERLCDFPDELWNGKKAFSLPLTNWTQEPVVLEKGTVVGRLEEVSLVEEQYIVDKHQ